MMVKYVAKIKVGDYAVGDEIPEDVALVWINMYKVSPIKIVKEETAKKVSKKVNLDLNGDGVVDKKDASIASKVMNEIRHNKKKRNKKR